MKNVTVTLDEDVARWARIRAAELDLSVSRMLGDLLREHLRRRGRYETGMRQYLLRESTAINADGAQYSSREQLHDRAGLR